MERRKFISTGSRWAMLGSLLGTSGILIFRSSKGNPENCYVTQLCRSCDQYRSCDKLASTEPDRNKDGRK